MSVKDSLPRFKVFGSMTVSPRGQAVIPANARKELDIDSGDTLLACALPHGQGLLLLKVDAIEQMLSSMSERLTEFEQLVSDYRSPEATGSKEEVD